MAISAQVENLVPGWLYCVAKLQLGLQPYQFLGLYFQQDSVYIIATSVLSHLRLLRFFLCVPYRPDGHQNNLRSSAYESLMEIVKNSAKDCYPAVQKTTLVIMERLQQVLQMEVRLQAFLLLVGRVVVLLTHNSVFKAVLFCWC